MIAPFTFTSRPSIPSANTAARSSTSFSFLPVINSIAVSSLSLLFDMSGTGIMKKNVPWHILAPSAVACDKLHLRASAHHWHVSAFLCNRGFQGISYYTKSPGMTFTHIIPGRDIPAVPPAFKKKRLFFFLLFRCLTRSHVMTYLRRLAGCPVSLSVIRLRSVPYCSAPS